jgi:hypothetical protein
MEMGKLLTDIVTGTSTWLWTTIGNEVHQRRLSAIDSGDLTIMLGGAPNRVLDEGCGVAQEPRGSLIKGRML